MTSALRMSGTLLVAAALAAPPALSAAPGVRIFSSIAGTEIRDVLGTYRYTAQSGKPYDTTSFEARQRALTVGLSATTRVLDWLSLDAVAMTAGADHRHEPWHERALAAEFGSGPSAHVTSRTRAMIATASLQGPLTESFGVYARIGAARSETRVFVTETLSGTTDTFRDATIRPWGGIGARYDHRPGLSFTAEHGSANEGLRMSRVSIAWKF